MCSAMAECSGGGGGGGARRAHSVGLGAYCNVWLKFFAWGWGPKGEIRLV